MKTKNKITQRHHIIYGNEKNKETIAQVRKGVHQIAGLIKRYKHLTEEEAWCIKLEVDLKREHPEPKKVVIGYDIATGKSY